MFKYLSKNLKDFNFFQSSIKRFTTVKTLKDNIFTVAIVGRPNVGKSTLFNKLAGGNYSITDAMPGITRDRKEMISKILGYPIRLVDTAGLENLRNTNRSELKKKMISQTEQALVYSDLSLFMVDIREGITSEDQFLANWLQKKVYLSHKEVDNKVKDNKNVVDNKEGDNKEGDNKAEAIKEKSSKKHQKKILLIANKAENNYDGEIEGEVYKLGLGDPIYISAEHGDGFPDLFQAIDALIPEKHKKDYEERKIKRMEKHVKLRNQIKQEILELKSKLEDQEDINIEEWEREFDIFNRDPEENSDLDSDNEIDPKESMVTSFFDTKTGINSNNIFKKNPINISVVGRPNVGKSTFVNSLLNENRVIADDMPGTTRDAISVNWIYKGRRVNLIDTAGIEKTIKYKTDLDKKMHEATMKAIKYAHVVICLIDALDAFRVQDLSVAQYIVNEGRGIILAVNKWDLVTNEWKSKASKFMQKQADRSLGEVKNIPIHYISSLTKYKVNSIMDEVFRVYEKWNIRVSTGLLNDWLTRFKKLQSLPTSDGEVLKIRFVTQVKSRPPTFIAFVNDKKLFKPNYLKFMKNNLSQEFGLHGVPVRIHIRDIMYKKAKKQIEQIEKKGSIKQIFLKRRKLMNYAKRRLETLNAQAKAKQAKKNKEGVKA